MGRFLSLSEVPIALCNLLFTFVLGLLAGLFTIQLISLIFIGVALLLLALTLPAVRPARDQHLNPYAQPPAAQRSHDQ
jgi:hypothetical protein